MGGVNVAADYDVLAVPDQPVGEVQEGVVEVHLILEAFCGGPSVREVDVEQGEAAVVGHEDPALVGQDFHVELGLDVHRRGVGENGYAAVSLSLGAGEEGIVPVDFAVVGGELLFGNLGLLEAEDVWALTGEPVQKSLAVDGAEAVDVPRQQA